MWLKIGLGVVAVLVIFVAYVASREGKFRYAVSGVINAPVNQVFPYLSDLRRGGEWSPFEKTDPNLRKEYVGPSDQVGGKLIFEGNSEAGAGSLEILKIVPNEKVELRLLMTKPFQADNLIEYLVEPAGEQTRLTWVMSGDGGFMGKLMTLVMDCEAMMREQFNKGFDNLNALMASNASRT